MSTICPSAQPVKKNGGSPSKTFRRQLLPGKVRCRQLEKILFPLELTVFFAQTVEFSALVARQLALIGGSDISAIDAGLLALLAILFTPLARREGAVFALVLTLHPISRMLLEAIRVDEPPALGTPLSISQLVSLVLLALAAALWWWILRQPAGAAPRSSAGGPGPGARL